MQAWNSQTVSSLFQNPLLSIPFLLPHWLLGKGPTLCKRSCERRRSQHGSKAQLRRKKRRTVENSRREAGTRGKTKKKKKNGWPGGHWNREGRKGWGTTLLVDDFVCPCLKPPARTFWAGGLSPTGTHRRTHHSLYIEGFKRDSIPAAQLGRSFCQVRGGWAPRSPAQF